MEQENLEKSKPTVILNAEQQRAFDTIIDFIDNGNTRTESITLKGKAGCGKTTVLAKVAEHYLQDPTAVSAISHKAKKVIHSKVHTRNVSAFSVAALLGMKMHPETGEFTTDRYNGKVPPIENFSNIIVDEASMIGREVDKLIMQMKIPNTALIYAGDIGQIRPIEKNPRLNGVSPVFKSPNIATLYERVRQGEGHPILEASDEYWDITQSQRPVITNLQRPNRSNSMGEMIWTNDIREVIKHRLPDFERAVEEKDTNIIKIVTYTNKIRQQINEVVRKYLFQTEEDFVVGDLMMMQDNYRVPFIEGDLYDGDSSSPYDNIDNSEEFVVTDFHEDYMFIEGTRFKIVILEGLNDGVPITIPVIDPSQKANYTAFTQGLYNDAYAMQMGQARTKAFAKYNRAKDALAKADHAYGITAHKSQGSTYQTVIVNQTDMLRMENAQIAASLIYTGMTRASKSCYMVNKKFNNSMPKHSEEFEL